jgi:hypothetical protein
MPHFDLEFGWDLMSVHLGLSTDGFEVYNIDNSMYSCWPVFIMPYTISMNLCFKEGFIFFVLVILGPKLKKLWQRVDAYDSHLKY